MLHALILDKFKSFGTRQIVPLAPITLLFGANSAGKSSILQSLLVLKQTLRQRDEVSARLVTQGDLASLGTFRDVIFQHDLGSSLEIALLLESDTVHADLQPNTGVSGDDASYAGLGFQFSAAGHHGEIGQETVVGYLNNGDMPFYLLRDTAVNSAPDEPEHENDFRLAELNPAHPSWRSRFVSLDAERYRQDLAQISEADLRALERSLVDREPTLPWESASAAPRLKTFLADHTKRLADYSISDFLDDTYSVNSDLRIERTNFLPGGFYRPYRQEPSALAWHVRRRLRNDEPWLDLGPMIAGVAASVRKALDGLAYLGPLRQLPERYYLEQSRGVRDLGKTGALLPYTLLREPSLVDETNLLLSELGFGYQIELIRSEELGVFAVRLRDAKTGTLVGTPDVGFGMSQVLPVIVQSLLLKESLVLIEQPELHLHPRLQAELGTLFARCIGGERRNQFIIETHSEHLILRLQRLVRDGQLSAADVSVIYVMKGDDGSQCYPLRLDAEGDFIDEWPEGFFDERFQELFPR